MFTPIQLCRVRLLSSTIMVFVSVIWIIGCAHVERSWVGATASQEDNVALKTGGPHEGGWQTHDVEISYNYTVKEGTFSIGGTVNVAYHIERGFQSLRNFSVYMNLLDDSRLIVDSRLIAMGGGGSPIRLYRYKEQFEVPETATAINFSYKGIAVEGGGVRAGSDDGGSSYRFWKNP